MRRRQRSRMVAFLDGVGFLDAMLTSFVVLSAVLICVGVLYRYFLR